MPIVNITDRAGMFTEIGKIHKGAPKTANAPGANLDYFRVEFREDEKEAKDAFIAVYGDHPREINIRFPYPDIPRIWDAYYEAYVKGGMIAQATGDVADGGRWKYFYDYETGEVCIRDYIARNAVGEQLIKEGPRLDKPVAHVGGKNNPVMLDMQGRLKVVVPEIGRAAHLTLVTTSVYDIVSISEELAAYSEQAARYNKSICDIYFVLLRRKEKITKKIDGKKVKMDDWMCHVIPSQEWTGKFHLMIDRKIMENMIVEGETRALPEPDQADYDSEWEEEPVRVTGVAEPDPEPEPKPAQTAQSPVQQPQKKQEKANSDRPYAPDMFKSKFQDACTAIEKNYAESGKQCEVSDHNRKVLAGILGKHCFKGNNLFRHEFLDWLCADPSTTTISCIQVRVLLKIMNISGNDFDEKPDEVAVKEIIQAHQYAVEGMAAK